MGLCHTLSVNIAPLLLRTGLAATFIWLGTPLMLRTMELTPQQTAVLANAEVRSPTPASPTPPASAPTAPEGGAPPADPLVEPDTGAGSPALAGVSLTRRQGNGAPVGGGAGTVTGAARYTPREFEGTTQTARRWVLVALAALHAAEPVDDGDDATPNRSVLPLAIASGGFWVKAGSIAFALIIAFGGYAVALGFFTRVWALLLAICTGLSMWVLELGPAWAAREGMFGFLPDPQLSDPDASMVVWMSLMLHLVVLMTALALLLLGPGRLSVDGILNGRSRTTRHRDAFAEDEG